MANEKPLSTRQIQILEFIQDSTEEKGYSPSVREIGQAVGLASPSTVKHHLDIMERRGLLTRDDGLPRALRLNESQLPERRDRKLNPRTVEVPVTEVDEDQTVIPLVGRIAAGVPFTAEQNVEDMFSLPTRITGTGPLFLLEVSGDSMVDAAICDGDFVVVRAQPTAEDGEIVAAMIDGEATVKVLAHLDGHTWLLPRNHHFSPIPGDQATILGRVVTLLRSM